MPDENRLIFRAIGVYMATMCEVDWRAIATIGGALITGIFAVSISKNWIKQKNSELLSGIAQKTFKLIYEFPDQLKLFQSMVNEYEFTQGKQYANYAEQVEKINYLSINILSNLDIVYTYFIEIGTIHKKPLYLFYFETYIKKILENEKKSFHNSFNDEQKKYMNLNGLDKIGFLREEFKNREALIDEVIHYLGKVKVDLRKIILHKRLI